MRPPSTVSFLQGLSFWRVPFLVGISNLNDENSGRGWALQIPSLIRETGSTFWNFLPKTLLVCT